jgi:uncharacterized DUF497 family protein
MKDYIVRITYDKKSLVDTGKDRFRITAWDEERAKETVMQMKGYDNIKIVSIREAAYRKIK